MTTEDFKKMTLEEKLELHRRMKDLGVKGKTFKKGGIVRSAGLARRKR